MIIVQLWSIIRYLSELVRRQAWATGDTSGQEVEDYLVFNIEYLQICVDEILNFSKTKERKCSVQTPASLQLMHIPRQPANHASTIPNKGNLT
jgi:hypothetical protein